MHGRAVSEGHDQPRMHGRAVSEDATSPGCMGEQHAQRATGRKLPSALEAHRWKPGQSGNPSGRRKTDPAVIETLKAATTLAARTLVDLAEDADNPRIRLQAAEAILNRVYGRPTQPIDATVGGSGDPIHIVFDGVLERWSR